MKFYLDTEFLEGSQKKWPWGKTKPTIDLISIGIVSENTPAFSNRIGKTNRMYGGVEYYAISKDFNLKEAWNRYDLDYGSGDQRNRPPRKIYWIRENVLKPIFKELWYEKCHLQNLHHCTNDFTYKNFKRLIGLYGKTNKEIRREVKNFIEHSEYNSLASIHPNTFKDNGIEFYTYYGDYDWVVFCWLFGKMIDLPKGFPMYSKDLKQILDEKVSSLSGQSILHYIEENSIFNNGALRTKTVDFDKMDFEDKLNFVKKEIHSYPKQDDEHNALSDAKFNKKLHEFLEKL